jgi:hypothetical protein
MARFRLKSAHQLRNIELKADAWLPGDRETEHLGDERGTIVGTGTAYPIVSATLEMEPLDDEAREMIAAEEQRLARAEASMDPVNQLAVTLQGLTAPQRDNYDEKYIPGFPGRPRPEPKKGA